MRPAVIPKLSELPAEPERRNAILDSAHAEPGPEQQPRSRKARKAETAAATAAAWIGVLLSDHENVTLGGAAPVDENLLFEDAPTRKDAAKRKDAAAAGEGSGDPPGSGEPPGGGDKPAAGEPPGGGDKPAAGEPLVPWIRLK